MALPLLLGNDDADLELLGSTTTGMIGIPLEMQFAPGKEAVFLRALMNDWLNLIDLKYGSPGPNMPPCIVKVFKITPSGLQRLKGIRDRRKIDKRLQ